MRQSNVRSAIARRVRTCCLSRHRAQPNCRSSHHGCQPRCSTTSGKTPFLSKPQVEALGFKLIIYPNWVMLASIRAVSHVLQTLKESGSIASLAGDLPSFREFFDLLGMQEVQALEARYGVDDKARAKY